MDLLRRFLLSVGVVWALGMMELSAESVPETNALVAEVRIEPAVAVTNGYFGQKVAAGPGVFVVGFGAWADAEGGAPLAVVYESQGSGLTEGKVLRAPGMSESTVVDLATEGERVAVGVTEAEVAGIYLFAREGSDWMVERKFSPSYRVESLAFEGGVLVAGAGEVLVYELIGEEWAERVLERPPSAKGAFGYAVDVDEGETIIVGSKGDIRSDAGQAYIFRRGETGWELEAEFLAGLGTYVPFGHAVAIDGDLAAVSSYPSRWDDGYVTVYERVDGTWIPRPGVGRGAPGDFFGQSIALDGRNLVVAAPSGRQGAGAAYLCRWTGRDFERVELYVPGVPLFELSVLAEGKCVAVEGDRVLAGAPRYHNWTGPTRSGAAVVFEFDFNSVLFRPRLSADGGRFQFAMGDVKPGERYVIEGKESVEAEWAALKEGTVTSTEAEVEVEIAAGSGQGFFRARLKEDE